MSQTAIAISDRVGSHIGRFTIKSRLGYGGMGEVFLAEDSLLKRQVALKAIKYEHNHDEQSHRRLVKEAERLSQLNDEHVARIYDIVDHEGSSYLVMEYVQGQTLRARLQEPVSLDEFFSLAEQALTGLAAAHRQGILHCDLKPENLMITAEGGVKILDFGFARRIETDETRDSVELSKLHLGGTPGYMAPEVLLGHAPDQRSDIFSLGIVLYEILLGRHPFRIASPMPTAQRIVSEQPHPLPESVPASVALTVTGMLAKDPAQRQQSCTQVLAEVRASHAGGTPTLRKAGWLRSHLMLSIVSPALALAIVGGVLLPNIQKVTKAPGSVAASTRQLVVLPFTPVSEDSSSRAFAAGLTDTMSAKLGQIAERYPLEIVATSEAQKLKVTDAETARTILGATMVLEGSMQFSGETVRVIYKLVDTHSLRQMHSGVITANAANPFAVQDRVIEDVLSYLNIELAQQDRGRMQSHGTAQPEAYSSYLRGRGYLQDYDRIENLDSAIAAFRQSVDSDPHFALSYAGLGQAYMQKYALAHTPESVNAARDACSRAADLDSSSPEGEICLGMLFNRTGEYEQAVQHLEHAVNQGADRDQPYRELGTAYERLKRLDKAESVLKMAIALRPQYWAGYSQLGAFYRRQGSTDQAIEQFKRVTTLAPDSFRGYSNLGAAYLSAGKYPDAIDALQHSISIRPIGGALSNLGVAYFYQHQYADAAAAYERAAGLSPNDYAIVGNVAEAYGLAEGRQRESRENYSRALELAEARLRVNAKDCKVLLDAALYAARLGQQFKAEDYRQSGLKLAARNPEVRLRSALVLAQFHQDKQAIAELKQALNAGLSPSEISNDPAWTRFASNPEYMAMMAKAKTKNQ